MKMLNHFALILVTLSFGILLQSCEKEETETPLTIQERLETETPIELFNSGVSLDDLYGKTYEGGLIFYLNTSDGTGLLAAPFNLGEQNIFWGCPMTDLAGLPNVEDFPEDPETAESAKLGDGRANTEVILAECGEDGSAAKLCADLEASGKDDWFLPSREELSLIYLNLKVKGHGDFPDDFYWTSTEFNDGAAWGIAFNSGASSSIPKGVGYRARPVRAF
jgi:hypothetical protein